jgi:hypothetical protein
VGPLLGGIRLARRPLGRRLRELLLLLLAPSLAVDELGGIR